MFACQINQNLKSGYSIDLEMFLLDLVRLFQGWVEKLERCASIPLQMDRDKLSVDGWLSSDWRSILPAELPPRDGIDQTNASIHIHSQKLRETVLFCFNDAV
jgi:hypothetical protein